VCGSSKEDPVAYIHEHLNTAVIAGPISMVKEGREFFGKTSFSFLVGIDGDRVRVQSRVKNKAVIQVAERAKSVVVTGGFMSSYRQDKQKNVMHDRFGIDARADGMRFIDDMIKPWAEVQVEGVVATMAGNWATIGIGYMSMIKETKEKIQGWRYAQVVFKGPFPERGYHTPILVVGRPTPKYQGEWLLHIVPDYAALMYGRK
jgi:hypothetical protein